MLDRAYARGLDVRVLFWRCAPLHKMSPDAHFFGDARQLEMLRSRGSCFLARWDRAAKLYCHHQKSWLIDAGNPGEVAFVGGINLNPNSVVPPGHPLTPSGKSTHDVYVEIEGPSASDVHHNFVQRWNEASDRDQPDGLWPETSNNGDLAFPDRAAPPAGEVAVQIQRTVRRGQYTRRHAGPGRRRLSDRRRRVQRPRPVSFRLGSRPPHHLRRGPSTRIARVRRGVTRCARARCRGGCAVASGPERGHGRSAHRSSNGAVLGTPARTRRSRAFHSRRHRPKRQQARGLSERLCPRQDRSHR